MIMMDADMDLNRDLLAVDGVAHSFGMRLLGNEWTWNIVCANSISAVPSPGMLLHRNLSETQHSAAEKLSFWDSLAYRDRSFAHYSWRKHPSRVHSPYDEPLNVESCFSGLSMYDVSSRTLDSVLIQFTRRQRLRACQSFEMFTGAWVAHFIQSSHGTCILTHDAAHSAGNARQGVLRRISDVTRMQLALS
jgi:hypothetical protein